MAYDFENQLHGGMSRRDFLLRSAVAGAVVPLVGSSARATAAEEETTASAGAAKKPDELRVAIIGTGEQGRVLIESCLHIPGIRFQAVCDIWDYSRTYATRYLKKYGHTPKDYVDYREMIDAEKDSIDAVIVASPDWLHADHTNYALRAGKHVYCEKEMSNSLEAARSMVLTARETGKLLQIGHQRRSNPRYIHAVNKLLREANLLGRMTHGYGQWNRSKSDDLGWPAKYTIEPATLEKYGYQSMSHFRNWRWYKKYGGGPIVDLGSHQIDIFSWVFGANPMSVIAGGGVDFYKHHEWYDNVMCIFDYQTPEGVCRASYQVLTTTNQGGFYETFMGENGSLQISEVPTRGNTLSREAHAPNWDEWAMKGYLHRETAPIQRSAKRDVAIDVRVTQETGKWPIPVELTKPAHQPHLENFFDAIKYGKPLNCPGEVGYETAVAVLKVNQAVETGAKLEFKPEEFHV